MGGTVDYWAKTALGCRVATTQTGVDMIAALEQAIEQVEVLLGRPLLADCADVDTGGGCPGVRGT